VSAAINIGSDAPGDFVPRETPIMDKPRAVAATMQMTAFILHAIRALFADCARRTENPSGKFLPATIFRISEDIISSNSVSVMSFLLLHPVQQSAKFPACIVETGFDRSGRYRQHGGDFVDFASFKVFQHHDFLQERRYVRECASDIFSRELLAYVGNSARRTLRNVSWRPDGNDIRVLFAQVHSAEIEHHGIYPAEKVACRLVLPYFLYDAVESAKYELFRFLLVGAKQDSGRKKPVSIFGNEPFCAAFAVFTYFLPDFHCPQRMSEPFIIDNAKRAEKVHWKTKQILHADRLKQKQ
jgi:hypothetical protein